MNKSYLRFLIAFVLLAWLPLMVISGEIRLNEGKTTFQTTRTTYGELTFSTSVAEVQFRDISTKLGLFTELYVKDFGYSNEVGSPKLPVFHRLIEVPEGADFDIQITKEEYKEFDCTASGMGYAVIPAQAPVSKSMDPSQIPFVYNDAVYHQNMFQGGPLVTVTPVGTMRAVRLARLDVSPVWYNPVTGKLRIYETVEATIVFKNADVATTRSMKTRLASPYFEKPYRMLPNFQEETDQLITTSPVTYVIVSDPMFHDALQSFVNWKTRRGFKVIQGYTDDPNIGNTTTSIKAYLQGLYNNPPSGYNAPTFVLFVGDVAQIPAWTNNGHPSDLRYCEYTGDNIPEVFYGRFSATSLAQLQPQIDKTLEYEQYIYANENYLDSCTLVAGADASHQGTWGNGQITYGSNYYFNSEHGFYANILLQPEPSGRDYSLEIRTDVSNGLCYENYTAHGSETGWSDPSFTIGNIASLNNLHMYPLMVGNCCLTSRYNTNSFGEELLRANGKGAVGYIGASDYSYWDEDFWWGCGFKTISSNPSYDPNHLGAYDVTFHDHGESIDDWYVTQGQMITGGNMAVESSNSSMKEYYWEVYNLMGDPSLTIHFTVPPALTATYPDILLVGSGSMTVSTEPYAYIGLSLNNSTFVAGQCADSLGQAVINFDPLTVPGYLGIVINKQNRKPVIDSIQIVPATGPYLSVTGFTVNDSIGGNNDHDADFAETIGLDLTISNMGVLTASNVITTISTADTNVVISDSSFAFDSIPSGQTVIGQNLFSIAIRNNVEDQHKVNCLVTLTDGNDTWTSTLVLTLNAPVLTLGAVMVNDPAPGGNNNHILDAGESATLKILTVNSGHAPIDNGIVTLAVAPGSAPYIILNNNSYFMGTLGLNSLQYAYFDVITNGITPAGTIVTLNCSETAGAGSQYSVAKTYDMEIGEVPSINMISGTMSTCLANFYDAGGEANDYPNSQNMTMTLLPSTAGAKLQVAFSMFDVEPSSNCSYDYLEIYDGPSTSSTMLGQYCGTDNPGTLTATNNDGALTFLFHSDYSDTYSGWESQLTCVGGPLNLMANAFPAQVCSGSSTQMTAVASGGSGTYTYQWNPVTYLDDPTSATPIATPEADITYTVTVNDGNTSLTSSTVAVTLLPVPDAAEVIQNGNLLESTIATGNQWYFNDALIPGATGQTFTATIPGNYYTIITDPVTGCQSEPSNTAIFLGLDDPSVSGVVIYPNPFRDQFNITLSLPAAGRVTMALYDGSGREVMRLADDLQMVAGINTAVYQTANLAPGVYFCKVQTNAYTCVKKVILSR
ncbi:MAG TPA: C25 family cysteine peptidase [Bacteroidales bacterium]|nr:C25 family cysteine peptidase [Bacteroidales bacterium]